MERGKGRRSGSGMIRFERRGLRGVRKEERRGGKSDRERGGLRDAGVEKWKCLRLEECVCVYVCV